MQTEIDKDSSISDQSKKITKESKVCFSDLQETYVNKERSWLPSTKKLKEEKKSENQ